MLLGQLEAHWVRVNEDDPHIGRWSIQCCGNIPVTINRSSTAERGSPFLDVPGVSATSIKTDVMHTFNLGVGGDFSSSAIVALCKLNFFPGGSLQSRMDAAYEDFSSWCVLNNKTASTKSFEKKRFHMKSNLGSCLIYVFICAVCGCHAACGCWPMTSTSQEQ